VTVTGQGLEQLDVSRVIGQGGMVLSSRRDGSVWMSGASEVLEQAAQRGYGCPVPGGVQGQVG